MSFILGNRTNKKIRIALTQIFGIGINKSNQICDKLGLCETSKVNQLTKNQIDQLLKLFHRSYLIDSELLRIIQNDVLRLIHIGCFKGIRHNDGLPVRGQRTHTNAKTARKNRILRRKY